MGVTGLPNPPGSPVPGMVHPSARASTPQRPRVGVVKFASCDGCQLTILDLEDELLALTDRFEFVEFAEATSRRSSGPFDVLFVEGSISTPEQIVDIVRLRAATKLLVTIGACATAGGIQALRTASEHEAFRVAVYPAPEFVDSLDTASPVAEYVTVDAELRGCPIDAHQLIELLTALTTGRRPQLPDQAVCLECKRRGLECVVVTRGEPCLGPVTQTGCGAICPGMGRGCYGCFGPREGANVDGLARWYVDGPGTGGLSAPDVGRLFAGFTGASPSFRGVTDRLGGRPTIALFPATAHGPEHAEHTPPRWGGAIRRPTMHELEGGGFGGPSPVQPGTKAKGAGDLRFQVQNLTRVEGEGSLHLLVRDGAVAEARLQIFEAPRYFEALVAGRTPDEVLDIVSRICGICPVAYQMSAVHAFEDLFGVEVEPSTRALRRLLYCAEWIESHALHIYLLHAPDFLGYPSAVELAKDHRQLVADGLRLKQIGNRLLALLGGRAIHPVSVRVGGWSRAPRRAQLQAMQAPLHEALQLARATVDVALSLTAPIFEREPRLVALHHPHEYPMNEGRIVSNDGLNLAPQAWGEAFHEIQVPWSNALQARGSDGLPYLLGPAARIVLDHDQLHPVAREALDASGALESIRLNPYRSIVARAIELVHATADAIDIVDAYVPPERPAVPWTPRPGTAAWATEAPRGLLFHRYLVGDDGKVAAATIVPPTSQNQAAIEADIATFAPRVLDLPMDVATHRLEQLIRSYDPCISCATHFLDLSVQQQVTT